MSDADGQRRREDAARRFLDVLAMKTEHEDVTNVQAFRDMCKAPGGELAHNWRAEWCA